jgi:hypothetical protein
MGGSGKEGVLSLHDSCDCPAMVLRTKASCQTPLVSLVNKSQCPLKQGHMSKLSCVIPATANGVLATVFEESFMHKGTKCFNQLWDDLLTSWRWPGRRVKQALLPQDGQGDEEQSSYVKLTTTSSLQQLRDTP